MLQRFDCYDGLCFCEGLVFFAPVALLVRTQAGISESLFFLLQALISITIFLGEIPTGMLADRLGYKKTLVVSGFTALLARILLLAAYLLRSPALFAAEAIVEGLSHCMDSGTVSAYVYEVYGKENYLSKSAQASNWGTAGFIVSTLGYPVIFRLFGISGLLTATVLAYAAAAGLTLALKKEKSFTASQPSRLPARQLLGILRERQALAIMALSSVLSVAGILITFFYADRLLSCGVSLEWMSPIILAYSLIQMLSKVILDRVRGDAMGKMLGISCGAAAGGLLVFGLSTAVPVVMTLMLLLPLLTDIPGYCLAHQSNAFIDGWDRGENRAASLSVLNMGVSLVEILALFASAVLTGANVIPCFLAAGLALLGFGIYYFAKSKR